MLGPLMHPPTALLLRSLSLGLPLNGKPERMHKLLAEDGHTFLTCQQLVGTFQRFLFVHVIPNVGQHISKVIDRYCNSSLEKLTELKIEEMKVLDGIGETVAIAMEDYFKNDNNDILSSPNSNILPCIH